MSKRQVLIIIGIAIMAFLYVGFPLALDKILALVFGAIILIIAFRLKPPARQNSLSQVPYVEHKNNSSMNP
ncbi:MAG: hypothetical protein AAB470_00885 [Patescibacteria group bacterium]